MGRRAGRWRRRWRSARPRGSISAPSGRGLRARGARGPRPLGARVDGHAVAEIPPAAAPVRRSWCASAETYAAALERLIAPLPLELRGQGYAMGVIILRPRARQPSGAAARRGCCSPMEAFLPTSSRNAWQHTTASRGQVERHVEGRRHHSVATAAGIALVVHHRRPRMPVRRRAHRLIVLLPLFLAAPLAACTTTSRAPLSHGSGSRPSTSE